MTSPAANTPGDVGVRRAAVDPDRALGGEVELAVHEVRARVVADRDEQAVEGEVALVAVDRVAQATPVTASSPRMSTTSVFQTNSIFSFANARSCMIFEARSESRRWMT